MMTPPVDVFVGGGLHRMPDPLPPAGRTCPRREREHKGTARVWGATLDPTMG
jgi:hypothetical protein